MFQTTKGLKDNIGTNTQWIDFYRVLGGKLGGNISVIDLILFLSLLKAVYQGYGKHISE